MLKAFLYKLLHSQAILLTLELPSTSVCFHFQKTVPKFFVLTFIDVKRPFNTYNHFIPSSSIPTKKNHLDALFPSVCRRRKLRMEALQIARNLFMCTFTIWKKLKHPQKKPDIFSISLPITFDLVKKFLKTCKPNIHQDFFHVQSKNISNRCIKISSQNLW